MQACRLQLFIFFVSTWRDRLSFIISLAWQALVVWAAAKIGFAMQVIHSVKIPVTGAGICGLAGQPFTNGSCRLVGDAVGNLDGTWTIFLPAGDDLALYHIKPGFMLYDPANWHMMGGTPACVALISAAVVLMFLPLLVLKPKLSSLWKPQETAAG